MTPKRDKQKHPHQPSALARGLSASMFLLSCILISVLSFISTELALFTVSVLVVGCFFHMSFSTKEDIGNEMLDTIRQMYRKQLKLEKMVQTHQEDIQGIREDMEDQGVIVGEHLPDRDALYRMRLAKLDQDAADAFDEDEIARKSKKLMEDIVPKFMRPKDEDREVSNDSKKPKAPPREALTARQSSRIIKEITTANDDSMADHQALSDMVVRELIHHAVENRQIDTFLQPIVRLPNRHANFYELFARIRAKAGLYLPAHRYMGLAIEEKLMVSIDNMLLLEGLKSLKRNFEEKDKVSAYFINIKPGSLRNAKFMDDLLKFIAANKHMACNLVFEMKQKDFEGLSDGELSILEGLTRLHCRFSLDHVTRLPNDVVGLYNKSVRFLKMPAETFLGTDVNAEDFTETLRKKRRLEANGIEVIIDHIESEDQLLELLDYDVNYGQGYLFGRPDLEGVYQYRKIA